MIPINFPNCMPSGLGGQCLISFVNPNPSIYDPQAFLALSNYSFSSCPSVCELVVTQVTTTITSVKIIIDVRSGSLSGLMGAALVYLKQGILCHIHLTSRTR